MIDNVIWTLVLNGAALAFGLWTARALGFGRDSIGCWLAAGVLSWAWVTVGVQILGTVGLLSRVPLAGWAFLGTLLALVAWLITRQQSREPSQPLTRAVTMADRLEPASVVACVFVVWAGLVIALPSLVLAVKVVSDGPIYHLFFAARWWKAGRVFLIASPFGETAATYFPANGDLWFAWLMVGWGGDRLARIGQAPFLLLMALAVYRMCRQVGVGRSAAVMATCWFLVLTPVLLWSFEPIVDAMFAAGYVLCAAFLLDFALGYGRASSILLAGLSAGLAWGTKMPAIVFIAPLVCAGMLLIFRKTATGSERARLLGLFFAALFACGAYWPVRNMIITGNPLYPTHFTALGHAWLRGWYPTSAMAHSPFYIPREWWGALVDTLVTFLDMRQLPLWVAAICGGWFLGKPRRTTDRLVWIIALGVVLNIALYWWVIPYRTQQRFIIHAFALAAVPLGCLFDRARWLRRVGVLLVGIHLLTPSSWPVAVRGEHAPWSLTRMIPTTAPPVVRLPFTIDQWREALASGPLSLMYLTRIGLGVVAIVLVILLGAVFRSTVPSRRALLGALFTATLLGSTWVFATLNSGAPFPEFEYYQAWNALERVSPPEGARIAYAGTNLPYYLMGTDLRNAVEYVNIDAHDGWLLHHYHASANQRGDPQVWDTPRPGWDRLHPDFDAWRRNLAKRAIDYLVVARAKPEDGMFNLADRERFTIERAWADSHPEVFQPIYGVMPPDPLIKIYRVRNLGAVGTKLDVSRHY